MTNPNDTWSWDDVEEPKGYIKVTRISTKAFNKMLLEHKIGFWITCNKRQQALVQFLAQQYGTTPESLLKDFIFTHFGIKDLE